MPKTDPTPAEREACRTREFDRCARCGTFLPVGAMHVHHRLLRSRGGTNDPANLIALCDACHRWAHAKVALATEHGYIVASWDDPGDVPVKMVGGWFRLTAAWGREWLASPPAQP